MISQADKPLDIMENITSTNLLLQNLLPDTKTGNRMKFLVCCQTKFQTKFENLKIFTPNY